MSLVASGIKTETNQTRLKNVEMALEALRNVIRNNPGMLYEIKLLKKYVKLSY